MLTTTGGKNYCKFSLATSEPYTKDGAKQEKTTWHNIVAWEKLAEICSQYLKKGSKVYIEGKIDVSEYEKDGKKQYFTNIIAKDIILLDSKGEGSQSEQSDKPTNADSLGKLPF